MGRLRVMEDTLTSRRTRLTEGAETEVGVAGVDGEVVEDGAQSWFVLEGSGVLVVEKDGNGAIEKKELDLIGVFDRPHEPRCGQNPTSQGTDVDFTLVCGLCHGVSAS